ncbi:MAG: hypothetical protein FD153_506 [Rhodospirillaceae bacterium]|nr:MAG: hypothetical protein FD153_506 [Rhodospirillaceae bacterium]
MMTLATVILTLAVLVVAGVLTTGIVTFMHGGAINQRNSLKLMNVRVATQGIAVLLLAAAILLIRG